MTIELRPRLWAVSVGASVATGVIGLVAGVRSEVLHSDAELLLWSAGWTAMALLVMHALAIWPTLRGWQRSGVRAFCALTGVAAFLALLIAVAAVLESDLGGISDFYEMADVGRNRTVDANHPPKVWWRAGLIVGVGVTAVGALVVTTFLDDHRVHGVLLFLCIGLMVAIGSAITWFFHMHSRRAHDRVRNR